MSSGPDGDDDELVEIELELDEGPTEEGSVRPIPPPRPEELFGDGDFGFELPPGHGEVEAQDIVEVRQPIVEAAEADDAADRALYEAEAAADDPGNDGSRRAALLLEVARLAGGTAEALEQLRRAFAAEPRSAAAFWALRGALYREELWEELAAAYATAAGVWPRRVDLLVERGRVLEDRLGREGEARAAYLEALAVKADHLGALLSLLFLGLRGGDRELSATAFGGLARRAAAGPRRAALALEEARAWRGGAGGARRAFEVLEAELAREDGTQAYPIATLLAEIETLTSEPGTSPEVAAASLYLLARRVAPADTALAVALGRERARLERRAGSPEGALLALDEAAGLDPSHPLVVRERLDLAEELGRLDAADEIVRGYLEAAVSDDEAVDAAIQYAEIAARAGRDAEAVSVLEVPRVRGRRSARPDLRALEAALAVRTRNPGALADVLSAEGDLAVEEKEGDPEARRRGELARASALTAAGTIQQWSLEDLGAAEELYRRALAAVPSFRPAVHALTSMLETADRAAEAADLLEGTLTQRVASDDEEWIRRRLVSIYTEQLGEAAKAVPHQQRLVVMAPNDVARRARLHDLEAARGPNEAPWSRAENLLALAELVGDGQAAVALRVEAGRALASSPTPGDRARGESLLRAALLDDPNGLAAAFLERAASGGDPSARAEVVTAELASREGKVEADVARALRFRLAHHHASAGRYAEALAALTPARSDGDPLARAWSYELARRSGEAILEVAVLSEEVRTTDRVLGDEATVLLAHGEALARVGDPHGAAAAFRRCLSLAPERAIATDAALSLLRLAAIDRLGGTAALPDAFRALAAACADDAELAAEARREEALSRMAAGGAVETDDFEARTEANAPSRARAEAAILRFVAGVRGRNPQAVGEALVDMAVAAGEGGAVPEIAVPLLGRAAARARLAGIDAADAIARRVWEVARPPALAPALSDLPAGADGLTAPDRPDTRRARARRVGGALGVALDLEAALEAERRGALGAALAAYGSVITIDPDRLEAWTGIRRVARAGGDLVGEARALTRLGALVRDPDRAAALLGEAADAYERAGRIDDAITVLAKIVELRPGDAAAYGRVHGLLRADLAAPGRADLLDALLTHRLAAAPLTAGARVATLFERAQHRLQRLNEAAAAQEDFKEILNIQPEHREALYQLGRGALAARDPREAAGWLERYLMVAGDDPRSAEARLDLAACFEATRERARAIETLKRAAAMRPGDPKPLQRLSDLHLRNGDWRSGVEALRASEPRLPEASARAELHLRIGAILRDMGHDPAGAAAAFRRASELDPLGQGTSGLVALYDAAKDPRGALDAVEREIADLRRALTADPLDARRLERLGDYLANARARGAAGPLADSEAAAAGVLALVRGRWEPPATLASPVRHRPFAPKSARAFWSELAHPAASGFIAELWPHLAEAAGAIYPGPGGRERRGVTLPGEDKRFAWIEVSAGALGVADLEVQVARARTGRIATPFEDPRPVLLMDPEAERAPELRFEVGRALGLLVQRATILERVGPEELAPLFSFAALVAGGAPPRGLPSPSDEFVRVAARAMSRKDKKALALQASRFAFEGLDLFAWHEGVLRTADRLGLLVAADVALSAVVLAGGLEQARAGTPAALVATSPAALDLLRFALGEIYPALRRVVS